MRHTVVIRDVTDLTRDRTVWRNRVQTHRQFTEWKRKRRIEKCSLGVDVSVTARTLTYARGQPWPLNNSPDLTPVDCSVRGISYKKCREMHR